MIEKNEKQARPLAGQAMFVLVHLKGAEEIAGVFGVARETVVRWSKDGAPIRLIGKKYQANYNELWNWLKTRERRV